MLVDALWYVDFLLFDTVLPRASHIDVVTLLLDQYFVDFLLITRKSVPTLCNHSVQHRVVEIGVPFFEYLSQMPGEQNSRGHGFEHVVKVLIAQVGWVRCRQDVDRGRFPWGKLRLTPPQLRGLNRQILLCFVSLGA